MVYKDKHYNNCHAYINRKYGKASKCENPECEYENPKRFEWALLKGREYSKDINDYIQLCPSCHRYYDFTEEKRNNLSIASRHRDRTDISGSKNKKSKPILQYALDGVLIKEWESVSMCARELKIHRSNIFANLRGSIIQSEGFVFKWYNANVK